MLTIEGMLLHQQVDNPAYRAKKGDKITLRRVALASQTLGLTGFSDAIELQPVETSEDAILHPSYPGYWKPIPIEYKRGKSKPNRCDEVQVAAQAICLEEVYGIHIPKGMIFYHEEKGREEVVIDTNFTDLHNNVPMTCIRFIERNDAPCSVLYYIEPLFAL